MSAYAHFRKYGTVSDLDKLDNTLKSYDRRALPSGYHDGKKSIDILRLCGRDI